MINGKCVGSGNRSAGASLAQFPAHGPIACRRCFATPVVFQPGDAAHLRL